MGRYLFALLLGLIALVTVYGVGNSQDIVQWITRGTRNSRTAISANPAEAQQLSPIERAGQNVTRQTSLAEETAPTTAPTTAETTAQTTEGSTTAQQAQTTETSPATATPTNPDAIPALW